MPLIALAVIMLAVIGGTFMSFESVPTPAAPIVTAEVGVPAEPRAVIKFAKYVDEPEVVEAKVEPKPKVVLPTPTPPPPPAPVAVPAPAPLQDPAVAACLNKFVGTECSYDTFLGTVSGTCRTLSYSPVTCIPH